MLSFFPYFESYWPNSSGRPQLPHICSRSPESRDQQLGRGLGVHGGLEPLADLLPPQLEPPGGGDGGPQHGPALAARAPAALPAAPGYSGLDPQQ